MESKNKKQNKNKTNKPEKPHRNRVEKWLFGAEEWGKQGKVGKRVQSFSYKMNKVSGPNVIIVDNTVLYN